MKDLKFRTPVKCQNGHKAFWYWKHSYNGLFKTEMVKHPEPCGCPEFSMGLEGGYPGWSRDGDDQMFIGRKDELGIDVYDGDIVERNGYNTHIGIVDFVNGHFVIKRKPFYYESGEEYRILSLEDDDYKDGKVSTTFEVKLKIIGSTHLTPELIPMTDKFLSITAKPKYICKICSGSDLTQSMWENLVYCRGCEKDILFFDVHHVGETDI